MTQVTQDATFYIHNTVRDVHTRHIRRSLPRSESPKNLFIGSSIRVMCGRPVPVAGRFIQAYLQELRDKERKGLVAVYTADSRRVNLETLEVNTQPTALPVVEDAFDPEATSPEEVVVPAEAIPEEIAIETPTELVEEVPEPPPAEALPTTPEVPVVANPFKKNRRGR